MRRKSERTAGRKAKASPEKPEKKVEKPKRPRTRRKKQSSSSENESAEETPVLEVEAVVEEKKPPHTPVKQAAAEGSQDQVWAVKTAEAGDGGEIQKLKLCLTRPPSTPERVEKSPRSKRKHSRATSSSDTPSVEGVEEKRKSRHRSRKSIRESKEESEKIQEEEDSEVTQETEKSSQEISQSSESGTTTKSDDTLPSSVTIVEDTPVSSTNDEEKPEVAQSTTEQEKEVTEEPQVSEQKPTEEDVQDKSSVADTTTIESPKIESQPDSRAEKSSPERKISESEDRSDVLVINAEEPKEDVKDETSGEPQSKQPEPEPEPEPEQTKEEVSMPEDKTDKSVAEETKSSPTDVIASKSSNKTDVVESTGNEEIREKPTELDKSDDKKDSQDDARNRSKNIERSDSTQSTQEETVANGQAAPIVISRKRRWGARPKVATQKSITISTDVLKEIIPDVKPVEFEEVIEEKKHKRIELSEKLERPILPKIVIDNTDQVELNRKERDIEDREKENTKSRDRESQLSMNRKISIVKDNDSIIARPPSPPRHKQSCILYITNLVRPFTLAQLKNLLQRTGRIVEDGFWIDRIKSKCYVKYETEDQAVETRHALHGVTWPVSNPKTLQVDFSNQEAFDKTKSSEETDNAPPSAIPGTVEDWLREQDLKRERGELEKPWERKASVREWDVGKNDKDKDNAIKIHRDGRDERGLDKRRHRSIERSPEPARKFKKKEEEAPAKLLDDLFRKTKTTPCIYWLPLSAETIAIKEEQRRQHMAEHERRMQELRRRRH